MVTEGTWIVGQEFTRTDHNTGTMSRVQLAHLLSFGPFPVLVYLCGGQGSFSWVFLRPKTPHGPHSHALEGVLAVKKILQSHGEPRQGHAKFGPKPDKAR